jgi:hypothetical protein
MDEHMSDHYNTINKSVTMNDLNYDLNNNEPQ